MADQNYAQLYDQLKRSSQMASDTAVSHQHMLTADAETDVNIPGYGLKPSFSKQIKDEVITPSEDIFNEFMDESETRVNTFLQNSGYKVLGDYANGPFTIREYNEVIKYQGNLYKLKIATPLPYTTTNWATDSNKFYTIEGDDLRQQLASDLPGNGAALVGVEPRRTGGPYLNLKQWLDDEVVNLRTRFGVRPEATARWNTDSLQEAFDTLSQAGGARIRLPAAAAPYYFAPSVLTEVFDNYGAPTPASEACVIARPKVLMVGDGVGSTVFQVEEGDVATSCFFALSPSGGGFQHMSIRGNSPSGGNSHGIINLNMSADPAHLICENWLLDHLELSNLGSYGIGIDNGDITNLRASNIYIHNVGADGIDTKQRGPRTKNIGMNFSNIVVDGFGLRLTGQAGLDFHGLGQVTNLTVRNMGLTAQTGFRIRTLTADGAEGENARMSRASNIVIENVPSNVGHAGILIGAPDCVVQGAVVRGVTDGFQIGGNAVGTPNRSIVTDAHAIDCAQYGYLIGTDVLDSSLNTVYAINCATGFRNEGTRTTLIKAVPINCAADFATTTGAQPTERRIGSDVFGLTEYTQNGNRVVQEPRGSAADIEVLLRPKGASRLALTDGVGTRKVQVDQNGVGFNGRAPAGKMTLNAAATDAATTTTLVNQIRTGLINNGLAQ